jgi:flagellar protein FliO/FliZ
MESVDYTRTFLVLAFIMGLIWLCAWLAKRFGLDKKLRGVTGGAAGRLAVTDTIYVDPKRKLLLVRADTREYVLLVSGENVTVIDRLEPSNDA